MKKNDVVVIGSGISGLLTALALSREGKKVLILEKEDCIGGVCRAFEGGGENPDTGPHAVTKVKKGPVKALGGKEIRVFPQVGSLWKF